MTEIMCVYVVRCVTIQVFCSKFLFAFFLGEGWGWGIAWCCSLKVILLYFPQINKFMAFWKV